MLQRLTVFSNNKTIMLILKILYQKFGIFLMEKYVKTVL